jgi:hypothetical protein
MRGTLHCAFVAFAGLHLAVHFIIDLFKLEPSINQWLTILPLTLANPQQQTSGVTIPGLEDITSIPSHRWMRSPNILYCQTLECVEAIAARYDDHRANAGANTVLFAFFTGDLPNDALMNLFFQWLYDMLSSKRYNMIFLIVETFSILSSMPMLSAADKLDAFLHVRAYDIESLSRHIVGLLPPFTVFGVTHCNSWTPGLHPYGLLTHRRSKGLHKNILLHLNHEQPYADILETGHFYDHCYGSPYSVYKAYEGFDLVVRYFYYDIYGSLGNVKFLPLGPQAYMTLRYIKMEMGIKKASMRSHACHFRSVCSMLLFWFFFIFIIKLN